MAGENVIRPNTIDIQTLDTMKTQFQHLQHDATSGKKPFNGLVDKFNEIRLRVGIIDNPDIQRTEGQLLDPLDEKNIVNMSNGKITIKWIDLNGGIVRPRSFAYPNEGFNQKWEYKPEKDSKSPEERTLDCYTHEESSEREMVSLTHPFIWANVVKDNWCGMNYLPPIGSIVIVGFRKNNLPIVLGYLQSDYKICKPYLKLGETCIKGYGNNYVHWRQSNKLDLHVSAEKDELDLDDPYKKDKHKFNSDIWIRLDAYLNHILISVKNKDTNKDNESFIEVGGDNIDILSKDNLKNQLSIINTNSEYIKLFNNKSNNNATFELNNGNVNINASNNVNITGNYVNISERGR